MFLIYVRDCIWFVFQIEINYSIVYNVYYARIIYESWIEIVSIHFIEKNSKLSIFYENILHTAGCTQCVYWWMELSGE